MPINSFEDGEGFGDGGIINPNYISRNPGGYRRKEEVEGGVAPVKPFRPIEQWQGGIHLVTTDEVAMGAMTKAVDPSRDLS